MQSGASEEYVLRKNGKSWNYYHPLLKNITQPSLGLILTQEQVMQTFCIVGGFTQGEAEKARKIIGKSKGSAALNVMRDQFVKGAIKINKLFEQEANDLFDKLITFGKYGFNSSHAVAYSLLTYWSMWLKANYPLETFAAFMDNANSEQLALYIKEAQELGILVKPPSIEYPFTHTTFNLEKNIIHIGLNLLQQIGIEESKVIISSGKSFARLKKNVSSRTLKILIEVGYLDSLESNRRHLYHNLDLNQNTLARFMREEDQDNKDWQELEKLARMRKHLSWPHSSSELPSTKYDEHVVTVEQYGLQQEEIETPILLKGWIYNIREFESTTKDGNKTAYLEFGDGSSGGRLTLVLPYSYYNQCKPLVDGIKTGEQLDPLLILVNPYFLSFRGLSKKEGKLNILKIYTMDQEITIKTLKVLNLEELDLKRNQMIVTTTNFGISKKGNAYCLMSTIDNSGLSGKGLVMMNRHPNTPEIGDIINGRWDINGFLVN